jgi:hypothetical protein
VITISPEGGEADSAADTLADLMAMVAIEDTKAAGSSDLKITKETDNTNEAGSADSSSSYASVLAGATSSKAAEYGDQLMAEFPGLFLTYHVIRKRAKQQPDDPGCLADLATEVLELASVVEGLAEATPGHSALGWLSLRCRGMVNEMLASV